MSDQLEPSPPGPLKPPRRGKRKASKTRHPGRRIAKIAAITLAVVLLTVSTAAYALYRKLDANIAHFSLNPLGSRPDQVEVDGPKEPLNILLIGSDTRAGQTGVAGVAKAGLSDTTILLHLSADRKSAYGVSIPRDLMVPRPACQSTDGKKTIAAASIAQWNAAYSYGGPACTVAQFEAMTNIRVDHVVVVDFNGFRDMVDALGGVEICVPKNIDDKIGKINLKKGTYEVNGTQALDYVRVRHVISDNGDVGRMKRQQVFLAAMANKVISAGTLLNPTKLVPFLNAATKSISTDEELGSLSKLAQLGSQFKDIGTDNIKFITMPFGPYKPDPNRLGTVLADDALWASLRQDIPLTAEQLADATDASSSVAGATATPTDTSTPSGTTSTPTGSASSATTGGATSGTSKTQALENGLCA